MKIIALLFRMLRYVIGGFVALVLVFFVNVSIPRSLGDVRVDGTRMVPGGVINRLEDYIPDIPKKWFRVELSSTVDLNSRAKEVSGMDLLSVWNSQCPYRRDSDRGWWVKGPYPDDERYSLPFITTARGKEFQIMGGGGRFATRQADGRFHYTAYVNADKIGETTGDLCLKVASTKFFSPEANSREIIIARALIQQAMNAGDPHP